MADRHGVAEGSVPGLADFARVSLEDCERALAVLQAPDRYSRSEDHEGRRILKVDGGWLVLNHAKYRAKASEDDRREYLRKKQAESRARRVNNGVNTRQQISTNSTQAEAEAEADPDTKEQEDQNIRSRAIKPRAHLNSSSALFDVFWSHYPRKVAKSAALKAWGKLKVDESLLTKILSGLEWQRHQPQWAKDNGLFVPHASTWLNQRRWEDEPFSISDPTEAAWGRVMARRGKLQ